MNQNNTSNNNDSNEILNSIANKANNDKSVLQLNEVLTKSPKEYLKWIYKPSTNYKRAEIFNKQWQFLSHTKWYVVLFWILPVMFFLPKYNVTQYIFVVFCGFYFIWPSIEYIIHKYIFHLESINNTTLQLIHYVFHGIHHAAPKDFNHLVMPLTASIPLVLILWLIMYILCGYNITITNSFMCGILIGYMKYDLTHFTLHKFTPKEFKQHFNILPDFFHQKFSNLHSHHMAHHFSTPNKKFGVSYIDK